MTTPTTTQVAAPTQTKPAGATPTGPQTPPEQPNVAAPAAPDPRMAELEKQTRLQARRAQEISAKSKEFESRQAEFAKEKNEFEQWKKAREDRRRNPDKYLQQDFGPDWYDKLTKYRLEGAPTGDLIASELDEREEKFKKLVEEKTGDVHKKLQEYEAKEAQRQQQEYEANVVAQVKQSSDKFPLVAEFGEHGSVLAEIRNHFKSTTRQRPDGSWAPGEVLTAEAAAAKVEQRIADIASKFEKYFEAKKAKQNPAPTPNQSSPVVSAQRNETPQRRALSTTVTATSTPTRSPPRDDRERSRAALAAWEAH